MEEEREWERGGNGSGGGMDDRKKNIPFRRKPESHSRDSEKFSAKRNIAMVACRRMRLRAEIPAFAGMEVIVAVPPPPIPAKAGISLLSGAGNARTAPFFYS